MTKLPVAFIERFSEGATSTMAEETRSMLDKIYKSKRAAASFYPVFLAERHVRPLRDAENSED